jgi:2-dehydropantoate 2-reductase
MEKMRIAILGPGAIGGFMAALLWKAGHSVTCVAREKTAQIINNNGINFQSIQFGNFLAYPKAVTQLNTPNDIIIIATKATTLNRALERILPEATENSAIVPLLNGLEHVALIRKKLGVHLVPATISMEGKYDGPAHIRHTTNFSFIRYASDDLPTEQLDRLDRAIDNSGIRMIRADSVMDVIWGKLVRLNALACTTTASGLPLGKIRTHPEWGKLLKAVVQEGTDVACAEGYSISAQTVLDQLAKLPDTLGSSMQRDVEASRPSELDAIAGGVVRAGQKYNLTCPAIEKMISRIETRIQDIANKGDRS